MSHRLTADQFVVGLTLNVLVLGLAAFLDSSIDPEPTLAKVVEVPFLSDLPLLGKALFAQTWPTYLVVSRDRHRRLARVPHALGARGAGGR